MKVLSEERKYTAQDFERLPEGPPYYQLINGELIMSPSPALEHQRTSKRLFHMFYTLIEIPKKGEVFYSPVDVYLDEENVFQPDIVVILEGSRAKMTKRGVEGAPDVVVEILSPSTGYYDLTIKKEVYERSGVKEYWVLDSQRRTFEIYKNTQEGFKLTSQAREKGKVFSEILGIEIDLQEVFP
jgi:Uma2 family endonuclease